jgi:hypothetical protein
MKLIRLLTLLLLSTSSLLYAQPGGNRGGYSRDGAQNTEKEMDLLFDNSILFTKGGINLPGDRSSNKPALLEAIAESDKVIAEFETRVGAFVKNKPTAAIVKNKYRVITSKVNGLKYAIEKAAEEYNTGRSISTVAYLQDLYLYKAYIAGAMKVYPEAISLEEKLAEAEAAIKQYGSREDYIAKMEKNNLEWVKSLRMKKAVMSDASIEQMVKKQYESSWAADKLTVVKVHITSVWIIEKNVLDIPLYKEADVNMAIKKADGSCGFATGRVQQTYEGGGRYSAATLVMPSPPIIVPCENLNK